MNWLVLRMTAFFMGMSLLGMSAIFVPLRQEPSEAYLTAFYGIGTEYSDQVVITLPNGNPILRLPTSYLGLSTLMWTDVRTLYRDYWDRAGNQFILTQSVLSSHEEHKLFENVTILQVFQMPNNDRIVLNLYGETEGGLYELNQNTGGLEAIYVNDRRNISFASPFPDGRWIRFFLTNGDSMYRIHIDSKHITLLSGSESRRSISSPDGLSHLSILEIDGEQKLVREYLDGEQELLIEIGDVQFLEWLTSDWIILRDFDEHGQPILSRMRPDGEDRKVLVDGQSGSYVIDYSRDGEWVFVANTVDNIADIYRVNLDSLAYDLLFTTTYSYNLRVTHDGAWVLLESNDPNRYGIYRMRIDDPNFENLIPFSAGEYLTFVVDPTFEWLYVTVFSAMTDSQSSLLRVNIESGEIQPLPENLAFAAFSPIVDMEWSPEMGLGGGALMIVGALGLALMNVQMRRSA